MDLDFDFDNISITSPVYNYSYEDLLIDTMINEIPIEESLDENRFENILEIQNQLSYIKNNEKKVLTNEQFAKLKNFFLNQDNIKYFNNEECNICIEHYSIGNNITKLDCNHFFHSECIKNWLCNENITCPICRNNIFN